MNYLKIALRYFEVFGFNVLPLVGKKPIFEWRRWQNEKQGKNDIENMNWQGTTGCGAVMGNENLRLFDLDRVKDKMVLNIFLEKLGFPNDYTWCVESGSGEGFHIYIRCKEEDEIIKKLGGLKAVYKYIFKEQNLCKHIELRWKDCQTALPYSTHESGGTYSF